MVINLLLQYVLLLVFLGGWACRRTVSRKSQTWTV